MTYRFTTQPMPVRVIAVNAQDAIVLDRVTYVDRGGTLKSVPFVKWDAVAPISHTWLMSV